MKRILVATDFSASAQFAVDRAGQLARAWGADLDLLHVPARGRWPQGGGMFDRYLAGGNLPALEDDQARLAALAAALARRFRVKAQVHVVPGHPGDEITAFAAAREADLVVTGVRGEGATRPGAIGGTALKVLWQALRPVLLVRTPVETAYRRVLFATDLSERARDAAVRTAALWPKAGLSLVHAFQAEHEPLLLLSGIRPAALREYRAECAAQAAEALDAFRASVQGDGRRRIAEYLVPAHPVPAVLKACTELRAELVVIGRHGGPHWQERLLGSVAQNLVQQLKADTLLFP